MRANRRDETGLLSPHNNSATTDREQPRSFRDPSCPLVVDQDGNCGAQGRSEGKRLCFAGIEKSERCRNFRPGQFTPADPIRLLQFLLTSAAQPNGHYFMPHGGRNQEFIEQRSKQMQPANTGEKDERATVANRRQETPMAARIAARFQCPGLLLQR